MFMHVIIEYYLLTNEDEKYDAIPEMWEGKNISDFIDPEIMEASSYDNKLSNTECSFCM